MSEQATMVELFAQGADHAGKSLVLKVIAALLNSHGFDATSPIDHDSHRLDVIVPANAKDLPIVRAGAPFVLWCCHVRGPDDVYAAPDYETALAWSDIINGCSRYGLAVPEVWPWSAEQHAENLPKSIADFAPSPAGPAEAEADARHG